MAVYGFFLSCLFGRQYLVNVAPPNGTETTFGEEFDGVIPVYTLLQFFFYMGWLKVAEQLINPFGSDDDDFDMNLVIDRNLEVSFLAIDHLSSTIPPEVPDIWEDQEVAEAPYTKEAAEHKKAPFLGSTANLGDNDDAPFLPMESLYEIAGKSNKAAFNEDFLDSMNSLGVRRRLVSQRTEENHRGVTDSGLELDGKRFDSPNEFNNPVHSNSYLGSGSTYSRSRIANPYTKPNYSPQYSRENTVQFGRERESSFRASVSEMESERTPLLQPTQSDSKVDIDLAPADFEPGVGGVGGTAASPEPDIRVIQACTETGEVAQIEVPAPPSTNEHQNLPQSDLISISEQTNIKD